MFIFQQYKMNLWGFVFYAEGLADYVIINMNAGSFFETSSVSFNIEL